MGEEFLEGLLSGRQKRTIKEGDGYEQFIENQNKYENACENEKEKKQKLIDLERTVKQKTEELNNLRQEKRVLERRYTDKKGNAPLNVQRKWEQIRKERQNDLEEQKQMAIGQAEEKEYVRGQNYRAALSEIEEQIDDQKRYYSQLRQEQASGVVALPEKLIEDLSFFQKEETELSNERKKYGGIDAKKKLRKALVLPELIVGLILFNMIFFITTNGEVAETFAQNLDLITAVLLIVGAISLPINFFFSEVSYADYVVFGLEILLVSGKLVVLEELSLHIIVTGIIAWEITLLLKTIVFEPIYKKRLKKEYRVYLQHQITVLNIQKTQMVEEQQKEWVEEISEVQSRIRELERRQEEIKEQKEREDREADFQLDSILKSLENERSYIPSMPDIYDEDNFLEEDKNFLYQLRYKRNELNNNIAELDRELREDRDQIQKIKEFCDNIKYEIEYYSKVLREWLSKDEEGKSVFPELNEKTVLFCKQVCIRNYKNPEEGAPLIIRHSMHPLIFKYLSKAEWQEEGAVNLIREVWKGFTKVIPAELLNFSVIDPSRLVEGRIGDPDKHRNGFYLVCQNGFDAKEVKSDNAKNTVRCLFEAKDIKKLNDEIGEKQKDIQSHLKKNNDKVTESVKKYEEIYKEVDKDSFTPIQRVNIFVRGKKGEENRVYHIVFFVVPNENEKNKAGEGEDYISNIKQMENLLRREDNYVRFGFFPIFLVSARKEENGERWNDLVEQAEKKSGAVYRVDLRERELVEQRG